MSTQSKILEGEWLKRGYGISIQDYDPSNKDTIETVANLYRTDSKPISFVNEWNQIKELANRQSFYVFPVIEKWRFNQARVLLVKKESIDIAFVELTDYVERLRNTYWGRQGNEEMIALIERTQRLQYLSLSIHVDVNANQSSISEEGFLKNKEAYKNWKTLKSGIALWCLHIWNSEKIDDTLKRNMYRTGNRFGF